MNKLIRINEFAHKAFALVAVLALVLGMLPTQTFAQQPVNPGGNPNLVVPKVKICHATGNGYVKNSPASTADAVGHAGMSHQRGNDIIPPFDIIDGGTFVGQNWNAEGQAIWNADCKTTGEVTITKVVSGGSAVVADFNLFVGALAVESGKKQKDVPLGEHKVTETGSITNYVASFSGACDSDGDITVTLGQTANCTITNTYVDVCPNIEGPQASVPQGKEIVGGQCVDIVVLCIDQTANNVGQVLPCTYVDFCPLVLGNQADTTLCPTDVCSNIPDVQTTLPPGKMFDGQNCVDIPPTCSDQIQNQSETGVDIGGPCGGGGNNGPEECTVEIASDTTDYVVEKSAYAKLLTTIHVGWTAVVAAPAKWIWGDDPVVAPTTVDENQTFVKRFGFEGMVESAELRVAADNSNVIKLNGDAVGADATEFNYQSGNEDVYDVTALIEQGNNELEIKVKNWGLAGSNPASNPAGLKYKLVINGTEINDSDCGVPYVNQPPTSIYECSDNLDNDDDGKFDHPSDPGCSSPTDDDETNTGGGGPLPTGTLQIVKVVSGSNVDENTFSYDVTRGLSDTLYNDVAFPANGVVSYTVGAGPYTVTENNPGANWTTTYSTTGADTDVDDCALILVKPGETTTCTITNTFDGDGGGNSPSCQDGIQNQNETGVDIGGVCDEGNNGGNPLNYRIEGYVWHDDNRNETWDNNPNDEESDPEGAEAENDLEGWTVNITNGQGDNRTITTDENGFYFFEVPAGTWTITEEEEEDWERTTQESHVVTVPTPAPVVTLLDSVVSFLIPTAYAAIMGTFGDYNFGNDQDSNGGGGGGGSPIGNRNGRVLGDSDSNSNKPDPQPLVLGEQVSAIPLGAADAGAGGAAPMSVELFSLGSLAILGRSRKNA